MRVGTSHFVNFTKACGYYKDQGCDELSPSELERLVRGMIDEGEISLGQPELKPGQRLVLIDNGTRYAVDD